MTREGLVEKKRDARKKKAAAPAESSRWVLRRLDKEVTKAFSHHGALTRTQVHDLEHLAATIQKILAQIDRNDMEKAS
jgi:hypothetical protein